MAKGNSVKIRIDGDASDLERKLKNIGNTAKAGLADVKAGVDMATAAIGKLASVAEKGIAYNATIEQLKTSFEVMTGSAEKATDVVERLRVMGAETPFETADLAKTTQLLMQYGFNADEAIDRMKMLGDVAQGNTQAMSSIALGYAQMASAGKVNLVDIKQMINGGFNPLQEISERTGESMASLYDRISKGKMTVDEITESMRHATSEGGRFYQSMEKQSQTLNGQLSTLKDNADQLLGSLTEGVSEGLRDQLLPFANNLVGELQEAFDAGGYQGLVDTATDMIPDLLGMMTGELQKGIEGLSRWLPQGASKLMQALPSALRAAATVTPQLTQALFEVASTVVGDLVSMLPELAPTLLGGFVDLSESILRGSVKIFENTIRGVENALHEGQTKIAGVWVDEELVAKFDFNIDTDLTDAKASVENAYDEIRDALQTDLLTPDQIAEIEGMIGDDYDDIKAKLMSFGLTDEEAEPLAKTVSDAGKTITDAFAKLNISVDPSTVAVWAAQANGSRLLLRQKLIDAGLDQGEIDQVLGVYDEMLGKVREGTPSIVQEIYDKLTDGKPDDQQTVDALNEQIASYVDGLIEKAKTAYETKLAELDPATKDYEEKKKALDEWYATTTASVTQMDSGMRSLVAELAGAPTAVVQARLNEIAGYEQQLFALEEDIERIQGKAKSAAENAFQVVRSGAKADEATISQAISLKATEFKVDEQAAEDAYNAAIAQLNADFTSGKITKDELNTQVEAAEANRDAAIMAAKQAFETALNEIFSGIAESEGIENRAAELAEKIGLAETLMQAAEGLGESGLTGDQLGTELTEKLAEQMQIDPEILRNMPVETAAGALQDWAAQLYLEATSTTELDNSLLAATYAAALQEGVLAGTVFDTTEASSQIENLLIGIYQTGATNAAAAAQGEATAAAVQIGTTATTEEKNVMDKGGESAGKWMDIGAARGIRSGSSSVINAAISVARATVSAFKKVLGIASPSKVMMELGAFTGEGYAIGIENSMKRAVAVAQRMSGQVVTAADISQSMRVNIPTLTQDIILANEQSDRSVNLYVNGKELGRVMAPDNQLAQNRYNRSIALGVGKK